MSGSDDFFAKPYYQRQLITFVDDSQVEKNREKVAALLNARLTSSNVLQHMMAGLMKKVDRLNELSGKRVTVVPLSRKEDFRVPPGHPRETVLYAGHPLAGMEQVYIPLASFHLYLFEKKLAEIVSILMHLGARSIEVERKSGWGREITDKLSVGIPAAATGGGNMVYRVEFAGSDEPKLPANRLWFRGEASWQQVARGRLEFGQKQYSLTLNNLEDYGLGPSVVTNAVKAGFELGGNFLEHAPTIWVISGKF